MGQAVVLLVALVQLVAVEHVAALVVLLSIVDILVSTVAIRQAVHKLAVVVAVQVQLGQQVQDLLVATVAQVSK